MMLLSRLDRYIGFAVLRASVLTIFALVGLMVFFNFVDELDNVKENYQVMDAFLVGILLVPRYMFEVFPIAMLLGGLLGLGSLASRSELVAMRAAGFSVLQVAAAMLKAGVVLLLFVIAFAELVAPKSEQYAQQIKAQKQAGQVTLKTRYGFWARDGKAYINIRDIPSGRRLQDLYIYEFGDNNRLTVHSHAKSADYQDGYWQVNNILQTRMLGNGGGTEKHQVAAARWDSLLNPSLLNVVVVRPTMLAIWDLNQYINFMQENGQSALDYRVAFWLKIAMPVAAMVMLVLAVPFAMGNQRGGTGQRIFIGAMVGALFFLLTRAVSYIAVVYDLNPMLATFTPALACLAASALLLRRVR